MLRSPPAREGMPLSVVAFRNDAPLHGVAVERPAGVQGLGVAPTARAMVNDEVVAVGSAEAFAELTGVISRADTQEADDDVVRSRQFEGSAVAFGFLDADAVTGRRLACNGQVGFADYQPLVSIKPPTRKITVRGPLVSIASLRLPGQSR